MARVISKTQLSDPGPSWPSCFCFYRAINRAFANLGPPCQNTSDAVDVRSELDLRIGNNYITHIELFGMEPVI